MGGDEEFFFGPEDMELSYRLKKYGDLMVNLDVVTYHKVAKSALITGMNKRKYYETKGFLIFIKKTGNFLDKFVGYSYFLIRIPYHLVKKNYGYILGCYDFFFKKL